jgi:hypothetical protein
VSNGEGGLFTSMRSTTFMLLLLLLLSVRETERRESKRVRLIGLGEI